MTDSTMARPENQRFSLSIVSLLLDMREGARVRPVKFSHIVTPTFSRLFVRVDTRKKVAKNRKVEKHRYPGYFFYLVEMAVLGRKLPRHYTETPHIVMNRHILPG